MTLSLKVRRVVMIAGAAAALAGTGFDARADDHRDHGDRRHFAQRHYDHREYRRGYAGGYYAPPPVVYEQPAQTYYAPPPVAYEPAYGNGGLNINLHLR